MNLGLTGGTGFVGQAVLDQANARGFSIRALTRRDQSSRAAVEWIAGDLSSSDALTDMAQGCDAILHIAGVVNAPDAAGFLEGNVTGTQNVVQAARKAGVSRLFLVSSLAAREPGLSDYGRSKQLAEEIVRQSGLDWTIIRPPAVYGPRDTEMLDLFRAAHWRIVPMPPRGRTSIIHVEDLARLLIDLLQSGPELGERIFEPDDGKPGGWSHVELARAIGRAVGKPVWVPHIPAALLAGAARLDRLIRGSKAKLTPDRARYMVHPDWVVDKKKRVPEELWLPNIVAVEGLSQTAQWYRDAGWL
ncbi:nucleoside-diphosphate-sugar epimerase [Aurantiacibacter atlanticus]|uniref:Nucleoside-diphosphate-sugar epimerase n=1 Tax=Aurantiacibacter atlanticus TaxID=1648404 RepID=A0A0H4VD19_9SPHN|nr:NAD(P)H-binding protein [Aurantiacibacter atlanticus]AKQ42607.1 nucleoside-diphosphate-sugar epimerase [Aurantiacibacter atlanticus]MDF1834889.1 NAD(P)H-binding protein [Alteraurantiacibacter sp. bin_em_oilr2.035]